MNPSKNFNRIKLLNSFVPLTYLLFTWTFYVIVGISEGHFPTYGNPDPKNYFTLYLIEVILMLAVSLSFVLWIVFSVNLLIKPKQSSFFFFAGLASFLLIGLMITVDPAGILNWLAD
ncbi:MAG: hypothetical protein WDZ35_10620 [Crocinitomicaceae bacterium]